MTWAKIGLPEVIRWLGVGMGVLCVFGIYWLFSSGKLGAFQALVYLHRYHDGTGQYQQVNERLLPALDSVIVCDHEA